MTNVLKFERPQPKDPSGRTPVHNLQIESEVLGEAMMRPNAVEVMAGYLRPEHFFAPQHQIIWTAIEGLLADGVVVNDTSVRMRLHSTGEYSKLVAPGDAKPLERICLENKTPIGMYGTTPVSTLHAACTFIRDMWRQREFARIGWEFNARGYDATENVQKLIDEAVERFEVLGHSTIGATTTSVTDALQTVYQEICDVAATGKLKPSLQTGLKDLDYKTIGLFGGELTIIGARPGMGKSALANHIVMSVAMRRNPVGEPRDGVLYVSMEMPKEQQAQRMLSTLARIDMDQLREGRIHPNQWAFINDAGSRINGAPIEISDRPGQTPMQIRANARRLSAQWRRDVDDKGQPKVRLALIVIDYIQKLDGRSLATKGATKAEQIGACSGALKDLAKDLNIPIVALAQVNRATDRSKSKRAGLADLRESGSIEADADAVWMLFRDEYYTKERTKPEKRNLAEISIEKARSGKTGRVFVKFIGAYTLFADWDGRIPEGDDDE